MGSSDSRAPSQRDLRTLQALQRELQPLGRHGPFKGCGVGREPHDLAVHVPSSLFGLRCLSVSTVPTVTKMGDGGLLKAARRPSPRWNPTANSSLPGGQTLHRRANHPQDPSGFRRSHADCSQICSLTSAPSVHPGVGDYRRQKVEDESHGAQYGGIAECRDTRPPATGSAAMRSSDVRMHVRPVQGHTRDHEPCGQDVVGLLAAALLCGRDWPCGAFGGEQAIRQAVRVGHLHGVPRIHLNHELAEKGAVGLAVETRRHPQRPPVARSEYPRYDRARIGSVG